MKFNFGYHLIFILFSFLNFRIIPFVAADAVMGVPNLEEDERLNLGGVIDQRTPLSKDEIIADEELPSTG